MLTSLLISDIVLIDRLGLEFRDGLGVLTGETGAGKSILLDGLALALGARGDAGLVRQDQERGEVTAVFELPDGHAARGLLSESGVEPDDQIILRRIQNADGRTKAFINDQPVSAQLLRDIGAHLIEIHGQHDERALVNPATHRQLLDAFGGLNNEVQTVTSNWTTLRQAATALAEHEANIAKAAENREYLTHVLDELEKLDPVPNEEDVLAERRATMMQAEKVVGDLEDALGVVDGDDAFANRLSAVLRRIEKRVDKAPGLLEAPVSALDNVVREIAEAQSALQAAIAACEFDPDQLERDEERLFALRAAARKHNVQVSDLPAVREKLAGELATLDAGEGHLNELRDALTTAQKVYDQTAGALTKAREGAATALKASVEAELGPLKLGQAKFNVHFETLEGGSEFGDERIEFWVQTNPGTNPGPLMKIASGGELSRFILALKVVVADKISAPTLIFDEIDTAIGGAVADAVGKRLARLAENVQVLAITHAPQVAARAGHHYRIAKDVAGGERASTQVEELDTGKRREEVARMLAGAEVTDEARAAADQLLSGAA